MTRVPRFRVADGVIGVIALCALFLSIERGVAAPMVQNQITARQLRIVDANGTLRVLVTGKPLPNGVMDGKTFAHREGPPVAGLLFFNDVGDEQGGLVFTGHPVPGGHEQGGGLTFDAWKQDQAIQIIHDESDGQIETGVNGHDRPSMPMPDVERLDSDYAHATTAAQKAKILQESEVVKASNSSRFWLGIRNGQASLDLKDAHGRSRLRLSVDADGTTHIARISTTGKVLREL